jgi:fluoride exporter
MYRKQPFEKVADLSPPSNPFSGFWRVISRQHPDNYLGVVAFTAILSEFLPLFLANVPARLEEQDSMSAACVWLSISVIFIMAVVLISSFIIHWPPEMPMDPSTVAGAMFYAVQYMESQNQKRKSSSTLGSRSANTV